MRNKRRYALLAAIAFALCMMFSFTACGGDDSSSSAKEDTEQATTVTYTNEEGKNREELNAEDENFYGRWVATSDYAKYIYGNLEMTINEDGTFDANVTDEPFSGTWVKTDDGIEFDSEYITGKMYFGKKCKMVIYEEDTAPIVMTQQ